MQPAWSKTNMLSHAINHAFVPPVYPIQWHLAHSLVFWNGAEQHCPKGNSQRECIYGGGKKWFFFTLAGNKARTIKLHSKQLKVFKRSSEKELLKNI